MVYLYYMNYLKNTVFHFMLYKVASEISDLQNNNARNINHKMLPWFTWVTIIFLLVLKVLLTFSSLYCPAFHWRLWDYGNLSPSMITFWRMSKKSIKALQRVALGFVIVWINREQLKGHLWCESSAAGVCATLIIMTMQDGAMVSGQWKKTVLF